MAICTAEGAHVRAHRAPEREDATRPEAREKSSTCSEQIGPLSHPMPPAPSRRPEGWPDGSSVDVLYPWFVYSNNKMIDRFE